MRRIAGRSSRLFGTSIAAGLVLLTLAGCAASPARDQDPLQGFNRKAYAFNDKLDRVVLQPISKVYTKVTPRPVRTGVHNFFHNLGYPYVIVNNFLQGRFKPGFKNIGGFLLNLTVGIGGVFDVAGDMGIRRLDQNFGATAGTWGIGEGAYLVLPFLGPTTVRGLPGIPLEWFTSPVTYVNQSRAEIALSALDTVSTRARHQQDIEQVRHALDPYSFLKSGFLQHQNYLIHGGTVSNEELLQELQPEPKPPSAPSKK